MAKTPAGVYKLLDQLWIPALATAKTEAKNLQALIDQEGGNFKLAPWDWWYYAEKLKKATAPTSASCIRTISRVLPSGAAPGRVPSGSSRSGTAVRLHPLTSTSGISPSRRQRSRP